MLDSGESPVLNVSNTAQYHKEMNNILREILKQVKLQYSRYLAFRALASAQHSPCDGAVAPTTSLCPIGDFAPEPRAEACCPAPAPDSAWLGECPASVPVGARPDAVVTRREVWRTALSRASTQMAPNPLKKHATPTLPWHGVHPHEKPLKRLHVWYCLSAPLDLLRAVGAVQMGAAVGAEVVACLCVDHRVSAHGALLYLACRHTRYAGIRSILLVQTGTAHAAAAIRPMRACSKIATRLPGSQTHANATTPRGNGTKICTK